MRSYFTGVLRIVASEIVQGSHVCKGFQTPDQGAVYWSRKIALRNTDARIVLFSHERR